MVPPQLLSFTAHKKKQYFPGSAYRKSGVEALKAPGWKRDSLGVSGNQHSTLSLLPIISMPSVFGFWDPV